MCRCIKCQPETKRDCPCVGLDGDHVEACKPCTKSQFQIGDRVYSLDYGWGKVRNIEGNFVVVDSTEGGYVGACYYFDGRRNTHGSIMLFHDKPTIIPPKRKVKKWNWVYELQGELHVTSNKFSSIEGINTAIKMNGYPDKHTNAVPLPWTEIEVEE